MSYDYVPDFVSLLLSKSNGYTTRVHCHAFINEKARQSLIERRLAVAVECAG
jgi:hypothetical protein